MRRSKYALLCRILLVFALASSRSFAAQGAPADKRKAAPRAVASAPRKPAAESGGSVLLLGWTLTSGLALAAGLCGALALSRNATLASMRGRPDANAGQLDYEATGVRTLAITADVLGTLAAVTGGISLWLTLHPRSDAPTSDTPQARRARRRNLALRMGIGGAALHGTF